jgi:hypothetical protein
VLNPIRHSCHIVASMSEWTLYTIGAFSLTVTAAAIAMLWFL